MEANTSLEKKVHAEEVMEFSPVVSTSLGDTVVLFLIIGGLSYGAGAAGFLLGGIGVGIGALLAGGIVSGLFGLKWLVVRKAKAAEDLPKLEIREGKIQIPCQQGESVTIVLNSPFEFSTRWSSTRRSQYTHYKSELVIHQGVSEVMLFSEDMVTRATLTESGFLGADDTHVGDPGRPTFAMKLDDLLNVWQVLKTAQSTFIRRID